MEESSHQSPSAHIKQPYQTVLDECRDMVMVYLTTQLNELFEQVEPVFLDFAKKAETNASQARFFDSINHILSLRDVVEHDFREAIQQGFREFAQGRHISYPNASDQKSDKTELEMIDNDALEQHIAVQSMIAKTQNNCYRELYALGKRMAVLRGGKKLADDDIPACPAHTAIAFQKAVEVLDLDKQILLIVYFLFGKFVLGDAGAIYNNLNERLINAGIFPNLKLGGIIPAHAKGTAAKANLPDKPQPPLPRKPSDMPDMAIPGPKESSHPNSGMALGEELFHSIHDLLTARRVTDPNYCNHPEFTPGGDIAKLRSPPAIIQAIDQIQPSFNANYLPDPNSDEGIPQSIELDSHLIQAIRQTLDSERTRLFEELDKDTIPTADLDTIELVGMLFEQVLNEEGLANIAKALISHLHTPYLKVAILDRQFITDEAHIARRLLNLMVDSGERWIDEEDLRRGIYYPMQEIVKIILAEFKNELSLFDQMFDKLDTQAHELEQRARILEERNQEAAKGRERLESARNRAKAIIQHHTKGHPLHPVLDRFLHHPWQDRMILMLLRDPNVETSKEWTSALAVIDSLARIMEAKHNPKIKQWLINNRKNLIHHIQSGLASLGSYHQPDSHTLFKLLDSLLEESSEAVLLEEISDLPITLPKPITQTESTGSTDQVNASESKHTTQTEAEKEMLLALQTIKFGTWFELIDDNHRLRRLKLSWFSPITHRYMFVDRFGIQAYITPSNELVKQLCTGKASIIKSSGTPFVTQALKTIHAILKKSVGINPTA